MRAALFWLLLSTAQAEPHVPPEPPASRARRAFDQGRYREAAELYLQAYKLMPKQELLYNAAQCWRRVDGKKADELMQRYRESLKAQ